MADGGPETRIHGTAIALGDRAALIRGPSGCGKSDLALRCLNLKDEMRFELVADDQVLLRRAADGLLAAPPAQLAGLMEVRGLGILAFEHRAPVRLAVIADLVASGEVERLPDPWPFDMLCGVGLPILRLVAFEASAPIKLALAMLNEPWRPEPR